jgi:2-polyprenyl-3-methyl-5-hydroxy-6-metoxy-1,4-benzoquinol methylase
MNKAQFLTRSACINCGSPDLDIIASGSFNDAPLHGFLSADPWGESPVPYLDGQRWNYVGCKDCDQAFHAQVLTPEWNDINFSRWMSAEAIAEWERTHVGPQAKFDRAAHYVKHVLQIAALLPERPIRLLDFGCGNGEFLHICRQFGFNAIGCDRSTARRDATGLVILESIEQVAQLGTQLHAVTLFEVLEHLDDPRGILEALKRQMAPGAILVLETPDCTGVEGIRTLRDYECIHPLQHINGFTPATLRSLAERLGFKSIRTPASHVTASPVKVAKTEARRLLAPLMAARTQQYFRLP